VAKGKRREVIRKGKKVRKNKASSKKYSKYDVKSDKLERKMVCPRCGGGYFLAQHKDRVYCGNCHYTEFKTKG